MSNKTITYEDLRKIVWNFADAIRDKGEGTTEDYAKVTIPTLALKRVLDMKEEFLHPEIKKQEKILASPLGDWGLTISGINAKHYRFYDSAVLTQNPMVFLLSWDHVMSYVDNPEQREVEIDIGYGQVYKTRAANFIDLFSDIIKALDPKLQWVFSVFNYKQLILSSKPILPYSEFYKLCHDDEDGNSLNHYKFGNQNVKDDIFGDVYMDLIGRFAHDSGKKGGEFFTLRH